MLLLAKQFWRTTILSRDERVYRLAKAASYIPDAMADSVHTEIRAALQDHKRVSVAVSTAGAVGQKLKVLIAAGLSSSNRFPVAAPNQIPSGSQKPCLSSRHPVHLTPRELQVLKLVAQGLHNREIAARIHRSIKTVEKHRQNLHHKLRNEPSN
jgi:DNA-binding NarL/FixJ family response regulator